MSCNPVSGLRDRKKAATRSALASAAVELSRARGIDKVTAEDIAAAADVSVRTFHNYFANKEDAILTYFETYVLEVIEAFKQRPDDEPLWDALESVTLELIADSDRRVEEAIDLVQMMEFTPSVLDRKAEMVQTVSSRFSDEIARRTGTDPERDIYPRLAHYVVGAVVRSALEVWQLGESDADGPDELVRSAFVQLRAGLPPPGPADRNTSPSTSSHNP